MEARAEARAMREWPQGLLYEIVRPLVWPRQQGLSKDDTVRLVSPDPPFLSPDGRPSKTRDLRPDPAHTLDLEPATYAFPSCLAR